MGTRADFYVGTDPKTMEYLGSIAWDGDSVDEVVPVEGTEGAYRLAVRAFLESRDDGSLPERDGWPWPWENSHTSDCAYTWDGEKVLAARGYPERRWVPYPPRYSDNDDEEGPIGYSSAPRSEFPDMSSLKRVTFGSRSGVTVIGVNGVE